MSGQVPEAAVEAGAHALASDAGDEAVWPEYDREAELVLTAAHPHIRRAVIEELAEKAETQSAEAYSGFDMIPQHLKGFPEGQRQRSLGVQANHAHWWLRAELEGGDRG